MAQESLAAAQPFTTQKNYIFNLPLFGKVEFTIAAGSSFDGLAEGCAMLADISEDMLSDGALGAINSENWMHAARVMQALIGASTGAITDSLAARKVCEGEASHD